MVSGEVKYLRLRELRIRQARAVFTVSGAGIALILRMGLIPLAFRATKQFRT